MQIRRCHVPCYSEWPKNLIHIRPSCQWTAMTLAAPDRNKQNCWKHCRSGRCNGGRTILAKGISIYQLQDGMQCRLVGLDVLFQVWLVWDHSPFQRQFLLVHASKLAPRLLDARCKPSPQQNHQKTHDIPMTPGEISSKSMVVEMVPLRSVGSVA